jgi:hypothetical protein
VNVLERLSAGLTLSKKQPEPSVVLPSENIIAPVQSPLEEPAALDQHRRNGTGLWIIRVRCFELFTFLARVGMDRTQRRTNEGNTAQERRG